MKQIKTLFYPSVDRASKKTGLIPIYLRISRGGVKTEFRLPTQITVQELKMWDEIGQRLTTPSFSEVNNNIHDYLNKINGLQYTHKETYYRLTPNEIKNLISHKEEPHPENKNLLTEVKSYLLNSVMRNTNFEKGTVANYKKSINHFEKFLSHHNKQKISISEFTPKLALEFYEYLQREVIEIGKKSMSDVSATSVLIKIKVIFNYWVDTELIRTNPFKNVKLQRKTEKRVPLSANDVRNIKRYDFSKEQKLEIYRDIFLFQVYTGLAYTDVSDLQKTDIELNSNGDFILCKKRKKTNVDVKQLLISDAVALLKKYENHIETKITNGLLPKRHLNNMNEALKVIQARVGITKLMTSHIARHTCAQFIAECNIRYDVMDKIMGWCNNKQGSRAVYCTVTDSMLSDAKLIYDDFLKNNL